MAEKSVDRPEEADEAEDAASEASGQASDADEVPRANAGATDDDAGTDDEAPEAAAEVASGDAEAATDADAAADGDADAADAAGELDHTLPGKTAPSAGTLLREAREARGLTLDDLARTLNLQPRIVAALERDDHDALPAPTFVRGYIRSYARLLGLPVDPLLADHEARTGGVVLNVRPSPRIEAAPESVGIVHKRPGMVMAVATVGFVAVVAGLLLLAAPETFRVEDALTAVRDAGRSEPAETPPERAAPAAARPAPTTTTRSERSADRPLSPPEIVPTLDDPSLLAETVSTRGLAAPTPAEGDPGAEAVAPGTDAAADGAAEPALVEPAPASEVAAGVDAGPGTEPGSDGILLTRTADGTGVRVYAGGEDHLHFVFSEDCWVEVRDADDADVYRDLNRDGETLDLWGRAPFRIRLGYAPAVELTYNGSRVALRPFTRNDVASLTLGR